MDNSAFQCITQSHWKLLVTSGMTKIYQPTNMHRDRTVMSWAWADGSITVRSKRSNSLFMSVRERGGRLLRVCGDGSGVEWRVQLRLFLFLWQRRDTPLCLALFMLQGSKIIRQEKTASHPFLSSALPPVRVCLSLSMSKSLCNVLMLILAGG